MIVMDELILKYLRNETTPEEEAKLNAWRDESPVHEKVIEDMTKFWNAEVVDRTIKDRVWQRIQAEDEVRTIPLAVSATNKGRKLVIKRVMQVAAAVLLLFFGGHYVANWGQAEYGVISADSQRFIEKVCLGGQKISFTLPDGSKVKMNAESKIIFPAEFDPNERIVELEGEAFFDVVRDTNRPFKVRTSDVNVKVLGTSFNVRAYQNETLAKVAVSSGKVAVNPSNADELIVTPNEIVTYNRKHNKAIKSSFVTEEELGWTNKTLYFKNRSFEEVIREVERWYGVKIKVEKQFDSKSDLTAVYHNRPVNSVMQGLAFIYEFEFEINDDEITIK